MKKTRLFHVIVSCIFALNSLNAQDLDPARWPNLKGYWKFQSSGNLTKATVGNDLKLVGTHQWTAGPVKSDTAVRIGIGSYYKAYHNIAPNGGGDSVNRYTLMFDFKILSLKKWHTFFQTDTTNANDGECFIRPNNGTGPGRIGVAATSYSSDSVLPNKWYRLVVSVNLGHFYRYYLNGQLILEGDTQDIDDRFALNPLVLLFADNNQEDDTIDIASVAVFDTCLSGSDIAAIGTIDPCVRFPMTVSLGNDTLICGSNTLRKSLGSGNFTYRWATGETDSAVVFSMARHGSGSKTIWGRKTDANGCIKTDTFVLGIFNKPLLSRSRDTGLCQGQSVKFTAGSALGNSFLWRKLPMGYPVSKVNNLTVDSSGLFEVRMTNTAGCTEFDTVQVTVHPVPLKPVINATKTRFCAGDSALLSGPPGYSQYIWSNGESTQQISVRNSAVFKLSVRSAFGCQSAVSDSLRITVHTPPGAPDLTYSPDTSFCEGDSTRLSVAGNYSVYIWNDNNNAAVRWVKQTGLFSVRVKDANGCESPVSKRIQITAYPKPEKPQIEIVSGSAHMCPGDTIALLCKTTARRYEWTNADSLQTILITRGGSIALAVRNAFNCRSALSDSLVIIMHPKAEKPIILPLGKDSLTCNISASEYQWYEKGKPGYQSSRSIQGENKSTYYLYIRDAWCYSDASDTFYFEKSSLHPLRRQEAGLCIHPNPGKGHFRFQVPETGLSNYEISIFNMQGQLLITEHFRLSDDHALIDLDLNDLAGGMYVVILKTATSSFKARLLISSD